VERERVRRYLRLERASVDVAFTFPQSGAVDRRREARWTERKCAGDQSPAVHKVSPPNGGYSPPALMEHNRPPALAVEMPASLSSGTWVWHRRDLICAPTTQIMHSPGQPVRREPCRGAACHHPSAAGMTPVGVTDSPLRRDPRVRHVLATTEAGRRHPQSCSRTANPRPAARHGTAPETRRGCCWRRGSVTLLE